MADDAQQVQQQGQVVLRGINWREAFPFTNIFRTFRVAIHPSKLLLALVALLMLYVGGRVLDGIWGMWFEEHLATFAEFGDLSQRSDPPRGVFMVFFGVEVHNVNQLARSVLAGNWLGTDGVLDAAHAFLIDAPLTLAYRHPFYGLIFGIWFLLMWSIFGGAICRIAAVHVARDEKISVRQALKFSTGKLLSFFFAPVIPLLIVVAVGAVLALGGLLLWVPVVGPIIVAVLFFLALIAGFVMTLVLLGMIGGMNLMYPTIAVEGSDSFDAISRSFSYVYARPWRMLFYTAVAIAYGALTYLFVRLFIFLMLVMTNYFVGWWLGGQPDRYWNDTLLPSIWPAPTPDNFFDLPYNVQYEGLAWSEDISAGIISFWVYLVIGTLGAFAISFYFSANTMIYYLMRQEVDATELDDVYVEQSEEDFGEVTTPSAAVAPAATQTTSAPASEAAPPSSSEPPKE